MINHAIGAAGVVSQQCKTVVEQYGQTIMDLLLAEVDLGHSPIYRLIHIDEVNICAQNLGYLPSTLVRLFDLLEILATCIVTHYL